MIFKWYLILYFFLILIEKEFLSIKNIEWINEVFVWSKSERESYEFFLIIIIIIIIIILSFLIKFITIR